VLISSTIDDVLAAAIAARDEAPAPEDDRYGVYCSELARSLADRWERVSEANAEDVDRARAAGLSDDLIDRLTLRDHHLDTLVALADETRRLLPALTRRSPARRAGANVTVQRIPKPLGVILMIYEARPTVTIEGALLPVAVGNVAILRGGSEMEATSAALGEVVADAASAAGLPAGIVQVLADSDRRVIRELIARHDVIDALIPRGSPSLIHYCLAKSTIPVIASGGGVNHLYVDSTADVELAATLALDSKLTEPTACNALEIVLVHEAVARPLTEALLRRSNGESEPWVLRLDPRLTGDLDASEVPSGDGAAKIAELGPHDDGREFLDRSIGMRPVSGLSEAIEHIRRYGSRHTEGIVASDPLAIEQFLGSLDAAALVVNGSLRLHDGPTMSLGPELSISTGRLHVRGPVDVAALLTYSWVIDGNGAVRGAGTGAP
jgi:glutamate-5-semialdehyde dehydrogenase